MEQMYPLGPILTFSEVFAYINRILWNNSSIYIYQQLYIQQILKIVETFQFLYMV